MKTYSVKLLLLFALMQNALFASAQTTTPHPSDTVQFYMQTDTTRHGIRVGQEFMLRYIWTAEFDAVTPLCLGEGLKLTDGPNRYNSSQTTIRGGLLIDVNEYGFSFVVRFTKEGETALPVWGVIINGKEYSSPPMTVTVRPPLTDIENVKCSLQVDNNLKKGEKIKITLVCNRRPDSKNPKLLVNMQEVAPSGWGNKSSEHEETYYFHYYVTFERNGICALSCHDLTFGGITYKMSPKAVTIGHGEASEKGSDSGRSALFGIFIIYAIAAWQILRKRYKKEKDVDMAPFILRYQYLPLNVDWALTHYAFPLTMLGFTVCFMLYNAFIYYWGSDRNAIFFPLFWFGLLPLILAYITFRSQRRKLNFQCVKTSMSKEAIQEAFIQAAEENNWVMDHLGDDCIAAHTAPSKGAFSYGQQIFVVFDTGQVWINCLNDLNKRASMFSFGYTKKNLKRVKKMLE